MVSTLSRPQPRNRGGYLETTILNEIKKVKQGEVTQEELDRVRTKARASLVRGLNSNSGLAQRLASAESLQGDWRKVFTNLEDLQKVTLDDIQRVARKYFTKDNRTVGAIITESSGDAETETD